MQEHFCNFSVECLTDCTQTFTKNYKIGLTLKFTFEGITKELSHQMNSHFWHKSWHLDYSNMQSCFKIAFKGGHSIR